MPSTIEFKPGDVVLVRFIFTNQIGAKRRPAVVMSIAAYHEARSDVIMMPITSRPTTDYGDCDVTDWEPAGLVSPSRLKAVLQTVEQTSIDRVLGHLSGSDLAQAQATVSQVIGLS